MHKSIPYSLWTLFFLPICSLVISMKIYLIYLEQAWAWFKVNLVNTCNSITSLVIELRMHCSHVKFIIMMSPKVAI